MSTLSFQDYVRERMLRRRRAEQQAQQQAQADAAQAEAACRTTPGAPCAARGGSLLRERAERRPRRARRSHAPVLHETAAMPAPAVAARPVDGAPAQAAARPSCEQTRDARRAALDEGPDRGPLRRAGLHGEAAAPAAPGAADAEAARLRLLAGADPQAGRRPARRLRRDRLGRRRARAQPAHRRGRSAARRQGGVFALVGATGVGKTTSTAKIAAAFATRHGAANLGLITLDAYRVAAHEQLRAYGRILGVPVHTAHDRASLEDLLELLSGKKMVLIDTAGMAQRDARTRELLEMLSHRSVNRLLVVNAAAQGETIEDVLARLPRRSCRGVILSKIDEAVKLGPALDAMIRHKLKVLGVANGQRVPEDWHRLSAHALVQQALRSAPATRLAHGRRRREPGLRRPARARRSPRPLHA